MTHERTTLFSLVCLVLSCSVASAHEVRPAYLELTERAKGEFDVLWKVPAPGGIPLAGEEIPHERPVPLPDAANAPKNMPCGCPVPTAAQLTQGVLPIHPSLPANVEITSFPRFERLQGAEIKRWGIRSDSQGLEGQQITVHGLQATLVDTLVRIQFSDGRVITRLLRPDDPSFVIEKHDTGPAIQEYFVLGVEHILFGIDHLLFVLALVLIVRGVGLLVKTITAFTIAHSITLALATLGVVHVPSAPVEAVIALSIVFVASEVIQFMRGRQGLTAKAPWIVAFTFGLLHGFGFAGALSEVGLPQSDIPLALLLFNVGVEAGQLAFVAAALAAGALAVRIRPALPRWAPLVPPYAIGSIAMFWIIQRITFL
ncbi:HupE/UreJ family protein [Verrucomicrobium spinosum]|uniref:HupE/UreJ family protein n=1 Tax=Verrucomicrobium spinosum TaxID=2736 RepID=UPI0001745012|nr:HupE/UreJ family protein [Verrucomicrobium spinosum]